MSQVVHNSGITYGNNNSNCGNTTNISIPDEKRKILHWISPFASRERHQAVRDSRVEKVGDWLLCNRRFSTWRTSEDRTAKPVLFCYGHPGAGKTYISSLVIDTLSNGVRGDGAAVAYVYCDFTTWNMQSTSAVLGSVLRQVVGALAEIPDGVQQAFEHAKTQADGCGLRLPEILDMLTKFLPSLKRAFICIDALDEFPTKQRAQLWKSLQRVVRGCPNTRLFLTGRPQIRTEVEDYFPGEADMVTIIPTDEDIKRYIEERLEEDLDKSTIDEELQADIRNVIPKRVSGIFLLVCLGMDEILAATTIRQKRQALNRMASGLGVQDAYNTTLDRIRQQDRGKSKLGMAVLMWVSRGERPLGWKELRHALGVDLVAGEFTIDNLPSVRTVLGCTLGLVTIDENASTVRLLHLTLQEYLGASPILFETPQSMMAETCLTYLNSPSVQEQHPDVNNALAKWPFLSYATRFWGTHAAREVTEQVKSQALRLLDRYENHVSATILLRKKEWWRWSGEDVYGISGLHCIAFWGIVEIAIAMLENKKWDVNGRDSKGDTPLLWAVKYGNDGVVELLLEQGDIRSDLIIRGGRTVLSFAAELGNEGAVKLLLERGGVNPNSLDEIGRPPLSYAAAGRHEGVLRLLVESRDIDPNLSDNDGLTPLSYAAQWGREDLMKRFLERGTVNPNVSDSNGRTPLLFAIIGGHEGVVKLLLGRGGVNPNSSDFHGITPLSCAAILQHEGIVGLLRGRGNVSPCSQDPGGSTPQSFSPILGTGGVELLQRADPNLWVRDGRTLLLLGARIGDKALVGRLLKRGDIDPDFPDSNLQTPLSLAASRGHEGIVKLLLERNEVNCNSLDSDGRTPLLFAALRGHNSVVKLLLERSDIDPNLFDRHGMTPLSRAAGVGHVQAVRSLLEDWRVDVNLS